MSVGGFNPGELVISDPTGLVAFRTEGGWTYADGSTGAALALDRDVLRRLIVLDPDDREQMERLGRALGDIFYYGNACQLAASLREFDSRSPRKPEEPRGLGAVVRDRDGTRWVRCHEPVGARRATWTSGAGRYNTYPYIDAVAVVSNGVPA